jgi:hypothetical protein
VVPKTPNGPQAIDNRCCSNRNRGSGVKAEEDQFYGGFTGTGVLFGRNFSNNDPIFFNVSVELHKAKIASN